MIVHKHEQKSESHPLVEDIISISPSSENRIEIEKALLRTDLYSNISHILRKLFEMLEEYFESF